MNTPYTKSPLNKLIMWYKVRELFSKGQTFSQISRNLGIHRETVSKYVKMEESVFLSSDTYHRTFPHKLDRYEPFIVEELRSCPSYSSKQIEDHLKERYGEELKGICSKTVFNYVVHIRSKYGIPKDDGPVRQMEKLPETPYGEFGQADFGEYWMLREDGHHIKVYFFVMVLCRSRYKFVHFDTRPFTSSTAIYAHEKAFAFFGGRPKKLIYDQDKVFLHNENLGDLEMTKAFAAFVDAMHFQPVFCRKSDPQSKGKVENAVKYVKINFLRGRRFKDMEKLNEEALSWLERTANGTVHHGIFRIPAEIFAVEKEHLTPYYGTPVAPQVEMKEYRVRGDNTISYHCSFYTVPGGTYKNAMSRVLVCEEEGRLHIYSKETGKTIAIHPVSTSRGTLVQDPSHKVARGGGITDKELEVRDYIGDTDALGLFLSGIADSKPRYYSRNLSFIISHMRGYRPDILQEAIVRCLTSKAYNANMLMEASESIRIRQGAAPLIPMSAADGISKKYRHINPDKTSLESFSKYFLP